MKTHAQLYWSHARKYILGDQFQTNVFEFLKYRLQKQIFILYFAFNLNCVNFYTLCIQSRFLNHFSTTTKTSTKTGFWMGINIHNILFSKSNVFLLYQFVNVHNIFISI